MTQGTLFARETDPATCQPNSAQERGRLAAAIIECHRHHLDGLTDSELCFLLPAEYPPSVKTCRSRLTRDGEFVDTGLTRRNERGREQIVWRLT